MTSPIQFEEKEKYSQITMDDGKANAVSPALIDAFHNALDQAEQAKKVVVLVGREGKFSAGFDLSVMSQGGEAMANLVSGGAELSHRLLSFPYPVIALSTGHALAMGAILLMSVDYRIGISGKFKIGLNEVAIGLTMPHFGVEMGRYRLNSAYINRAVVNAEVFSPEGAVEAGYLDQAVSPEDAMSALEQQVEALSGLNMDAHHGTKLRVREPLLKGIKDGIEKDFGPNGEWAKQAL